MKALSRPNESALPSLDKVRTILAAAETIRDVQKVKALAQAVANCEVSEDARERAHKIVILAKARMGELTRAMPKVPPRVSGKAGGKGTSKAEVPSKRDSLKAEGVSEKQAAEAEKLAAMKDSGDLDRVLAAVGTGARVSPIVDLGRMTAPQRKKAIAKLSDAKGAGDIKRAIAEVKLDDKRTLAAELDAKPLPLPGGKYNVIAIDPPWKYDSRAEDTSHRGKNQYPDMTIEQLAALPVGALADKDCVLWLWVTNAFMREAYTLLDAWGFNAKTILTWDKVNIGLGDYLRNVTEHCIVATRGRPVLTLTNQTTLITEKRREHSRKPDAFYTLVESLCHGSKVEMFSRAPREGWSAWGAETGKFAAAS